MKIDLVKQLINEFENSEVFKMKVEICLLYTSPSPRDA